MIAATHIALLRGINVGGTNKLPMNALAEIFVEAGCEDVRTFIQSGNVCFTGMPDVSARVADLITAEIAARFGYRVPVILRTFGQIADIVSSNPFLNAGGPEDSLHVMFLAGVPNAQSVAKLDPDRSLPDEFRVRGQEVYLRLPNGVANTKLTNAYFDARLGTTSTGRNWRTVTKLFEMMVAL